MSVQILDISLSVFLIEQNKLNICIHIKDFETKEMQPKLIMFIILQLHQK